MWEIVLLRMREFTLEQKGTAFNDPFFMPADP